MTTRPTSDAVARTAVLAATLGACVWLAQLVPPSFLDADARASAPFDDQISSWLQGRWDLPRGGAERFEVDGKAYVYFGPTPALLRLPFASWVIDHPGKFAFVSTFLGVCVALTGALLMAREATRDAPGSLLALALAGLILIIGSRPSVYNEAIVWGSGLVMASASLLLRYARSSRATDLAAAGACAVLAVLARAIWVPAAAALFGGTLVLLLVGRRPAPVDVPAAPPARAAGHTFLSAVILGAVVGAPLVVHHMKFGEWGLVPPFPKHTWYDEARLDRIGGAMFHLANLRTGVYNYFSPAAVSYSRTFPYVHEVEPRVFPEARMDISELFLGLPHAAGALLLLSLVGAAGAWRRRGQRLALAAAVALGIGSASLLLFGALCGRYLFDFVPPLTLGAALGIAALRRTRHARLWLAGAAVIAAYNALVGAALAAQHQRYLAPPMRRTQVEALAARIDGPLR